MMFGGVIMARRILSHITLGEILRKMRCVWGLGGVWNMTRTAVRSQLQSAFGDVFTYLFWAFIIKIPPEFL